MSSRHSSRPVAVLATGLGALLLVGCGHARGAVESAPAPRPAPAASGLVWADGPALVPPADIAVPVAPSSGTAQTIVVTIGSPPS